MGLSKFILSLVLVMAVSLSMHAQWTPGTNIVYTTDNVGIGVSNPSDILHIDGNFNGAVNVLKLENSNSTYNQNFIFSLETNKDLKIDGASSGGGFQFDAGTNGFKYSINGSQVAILDQSGQLGLGTTTPAGILDLQAPKPGSTLKLRLWNNTTNTNGTESRIDIPVFNGAGGLSIRQMVSSGGGFNETGSAYDSWIHTHQGASNIYMSAGNAAGQAPAIKHFTLASGGYLGLSTISPEAKLHVVQSSEADWSGYLQNTHANGSGLKIRAGDGSGSNTTKAFLVEDNSGSITRFVVQTNGAVGIGTNPPENSIYKLEAAGNIRANTGNDGGFYLTASNAGASGMFRQNGNNVVFKAGGTEAMSITSNGYVGIGTDNPTEELHVLGDMILDDLRDISLDPRGGIISFRGDAGGWAMGTYVKGSSGTSYGGFGFQGSANTLLNYYIGTHGDKKVTVLANGNVGIGTDAPGRKLDVNGDIRTAHGSGGTLTLYETDITRSNRFIAGADLDGAYINSTYASGGTGDIRIQTVSTERMRITQSGNVGIGTTDPGNYKLAVEGTIGARSVKVTGASWADYVFNPSYNLLSLKEIESYIDENGHLPNVPSASEIEENGFVLEEMDAKLMEKIEELTLYLIEQQKHNEKQEARIQQLEKELAALKN